MSIPHIRYRLAVALWPDALVRKDPRVDVMIRAAFQAGRIVSMPPLAAPPMRSDETSPGT